MIGSITERIRDFVIGCGSATPERVAEAIPELAEHGGAQRALLLMRLDPTLERTGTEMWAARGTAITDNRRVQKSVERFFAAIDRAGAPLSSAVAAVAKDTGLSTMRVKDLLCEMFVVHNTLLLNRRIG